MKKSVRRVLFYLFFAAFCILAPAIVLYTAGYRFSIKSGVDLDVGSLSITTTPARVAITFGDSDTQKRTPHVFQELNPGRYDVTLSREGFLPWQGMVQVLPGLTTYIQHIILFKVGSPSQLPPVIEPSDTAAFFDKTIAYTTTVSSTDHTILTLSLFNVRSGNIKEIDTLPGTAAYTLTWSKDGSYLLAQNKHDIRIYDNSGAKIDPMIANDITFTRAFWDTQRDEIIYIEASYPTQEDSAVVYEIDLQKSSLDPVVHPAGTIGVVDNAAFLINQSFTTSILAILRNGNTQELAHLPRSTYTLVDMKDQNHVLADQQGDFYLVNLTNNDVIEIPAHSSQYAWDESDNRFAYANDTELLIVSPKQKQSDLLLRLTNGVSHLAWHPSGQRLLFSTDTTIEAIDGYQYTFTRDHATLATMEHIEQFWIDARGKYLYILGTQNGAHGMYTLRIK